MAELLGKEQNTLYLDAGEVTTVTFPAAIMLEFFNLSGGTVWMKWHDDFQPAVGGEDSTPLPPGMSYERTLGKVGLVAYAPATFVVNMLRSA